MNNLSITSPLHLQEQRYCLYYVIDHGGEILIFNCDCNSTETKYCAITQFQKMPLLLVIEATFD